MWGTRCIWGELADELVMAQIWALTPIQLTPGFFSIMNTKSAFSQPKICTGSVNDLNHSVDFIFPPPRNHRAGGQKKSPTPHISNQSPRSPSSFCRALPTQHLVFKIPVTDFYPPLVGFSKDSPHHIDKKIILTIHTVNSCISWYCPKKKEYFYCHKKGILTAAIKYF